MLVWLKAILRVTFQPLPVLWLTGDLGYLYGLTIQE